MPDTTEKKPRLELLVVTDGWRWTLTDHAGTTQGSESNFEGAALQAHKCLLAHLRGVSA